MRMGCFFIFFYFFIFLLTFIKMMLLAQQEYKMFSEADVSYIIRTIINEVLDWNDTTADMRLSPWHTPIWWRNNAIVGGLWDMIWL